MYRIAVLAEQEAERQRYAEQITRFCESKGLFPQVVQYDDRSNAEEAVRIARLAREVCHTERCSNQCCHCTLRGGRAECSGAPSFLMSRVPDDLVQ